MSKQCATDVVARTITVAPGVYAPGHLGELTRFVPFELVDAVLDESRAVQRRLRALPSRVGVYLLLAMGLFEQVSMTGVWDKLTFSLSGRTLAAPSETALRALRRRIGAAPLQLLFDTLAVPLAPPGLTGTCYRRWRTVAFDGCSSIKAPDHPRNRAWLGKVTYHAGPAGYPALLLMALVETGTRGMLGAVFGPANSGELGYAGRLLDRIDAQMLILLDRGFDSNDFLHAVAGTGAQFLARAKSNRRPVIAARLPDGSYLTRIAGSTLRVIEARITATGTDGAKVTGHYRLITTLTDHRTDPATALIRLYHERWEIESAYYALRHTLIGTRVLRSKDPAGLTQELWALLICYQTLRMAITDAATLHREIDPDRLGFTLALQAARDSVITATGILPDDGDPLGRIGRALIASPMRPRRPRFSARKVKCPISRYAAAKDADRPASSTRILAINVLVLEPTPHTRPKRGPGKPGNRAAATLDRVRSARAQAILALLSTDPNRAWPARQIAQAIGHTGPYRILNTQLGQWADNGLIHKTAPATYSLTPAQPLTQNPKP